MQPRTPFTRRCYTARQQGGFALLLTIFMLTALTLAVAYIAVRTNDLLSVAAQSKSFTQAQIDMQSTRAELLFRLAVNSPSWQGFGAPGNNIRPDDRPYTGVGAATVRLQDQNGLFNINLASPDRVSRLLALAGQPTERAAILADQVADYIDGDDLRRLYGAERAEYQAAKLPGPNNYPLAIPFELGGVLGFNGNTDLVASLEPLITTSPAAARLNPNSAPAMVLASIDGISPEAAQQLILARQDRRLDIPDLVAAGASADRNALFFGVAPAPGLSLRVTLQHPSLGWARRIGVTLTPSGAQAPWRIDYTYAIDSKAVTQHVSNDPSVQPLPSVLVSPPTQAPNVPAPFQ